MSETERLRAALEKYGLDLAVMTLAFHGRDRGTPRQEKMLDDLEELARKADRAIRAALASPPVGEVTPEQRLIAAAKEVAEETEVERMRAERKYLLDPRIANQRAEITRLVTRAESAEARAAALAEGLREAGEYVCWSGVATDWKREELLTRIDALLAPDAAQARDAEERE